MSNQIEELAARFEALTEELATLVAGCDAARWRQPCANDERPVGVVALHVAEVNTAFAHIVGVFAAGQTYSPSVSMAAVDQENAAQAGARADVTQTEVLETLRAGAAEVARQLRRLDDADLPRLAGSFGGHELSVGQVLELVVIGHTAEHLASLRATLGG